MIYFITATTDGGNGLYTFHKLASNPPITSSIIPTVDQKYSTRSNTITAIGCRFVILICSNDYVVDTRIYAIHYTI